MNIIYLRNILIRYNYIYWCFYKIENAIFNLNVRSRIWDHLLYFLWSSFHKLIWDFGFYLFLLYSLALDFSVLNPGGLNFNALFFILEGFEFGVRITINLSLWIGVSALHFYALTTTCTKASEIWAIFDYGHLKY